MALLIGCESLSKTFGPRTLFKGLSFSIAEGERAGLIGANGSGKSTLLKILAGIEHADDGEVTTKRNLRLAYMPQVDLFEEGATVRSVVAEALDAEHHLDEGERLARAGMTLGRVGFRDLDVPVSALSGGWRKRLALAREVAKQPELLLMDEPTNHLDLEGIRWLEEYLAAAPFALLVVSHDRYLLENATTRVVEIGRQYPLGTLSVEGPFSQFLAKREEFLEAQDAEQRALASKVRREIEWLRRGAKARTTKAKGRIEEAGRMMKDLAELKVRNTAATTRAAEFDFTGSDRKTKKLIAVEKVSKSLGGRKLFENLSFVLGPGMKLGLLGLNGSGKTTLIRVITKQIEPDNGTVKHADGLKVVVFDQARAQLDQSVTLRRGLAPNGDKLTYQGQAIHVTGWARRFLFRVEQLDLPVSELSGGEQARVLIAQLMLQPADVLILDEPTNDLDIPSIEVLEDSLEEFPGALVLVTHDRFMLDRLADGFVGLDGRGGAGLYADLGQWERAVEAGEGQAKAAAKAAAAGPSAAPVASKPKKGLTYMEQRELEQIEGKLMAAEEELEKSHAEMADPAVMADHKRMAEACECGRVAQEAVDRIYRRWEELEGKRKG